MVGCDRRHYGKGYCRLHWDRWKRHGDPLLGAMSTNRQRTCPACGQSFRIREGRSGSNSRRICYSCAPAPGQPASCLACGVQFTVYSGRHYACSRPCKKRVAGIQKIGFFDCSECGRCFTAHGNVLGRLAEGKPGYCSQDCRRVAKNRISRESWKRNYENAKRLARTNTARRRARSRGLKTESFTHEQVFERDGWYCHICRKRIDRTLAWPDPMAAQLDHLVPVSLGGEHTLANVAAAHAFCNGSKGARPRGEQLRLLG